MRKCEPGPFDSMKRKTWLSFTSVVLCLTGIFLILLSNDSVMAALQDFLNIPGREFQIGTATVTKPRHWLLLSSRDAINAQNKIFGIVPGWVLWKAQRAPRERYLSFRIQAPSGNINITFLETEPSLNQRLSTIPRNGEDPSLSRIACSWDQRRILDFDAIECKAQTTRVIYFPEVQVTAIIEPSNDAVLDSVKIKKS